MAILDNLTADSVLRRAELAELLTALGFPHSTGGLANLAVRGGGPPFSKYGKTVIYRWGDGLAWAQARKTPARATTAEHRAAGVKIPGSRRREEAEQFLVGLKA